MSDNTKLTKQLPLVCTRGVVVFPEQEVIIDVGRSKSVHAVEDSQNDYDAKIVLVAQKELNVENPKVTDLYEFGTLCTIKHIRRMDGYLRVKFKGVQRAAITNVIDSAVGMSAEIEIKEDIAQESLEEIALVRKIAKQFENMDITNVNIPKDMVNNLAKGASAAQMTKMIGQLFPFTLERKQELLETLEINERLLIILQELESEKELSLLENRINEKVKTRIEEGQKEYYLREKLRAIK